MVKMTDKPLFPIASGHMAGIAAILALAHGRSSQVGRFLQESPLSVHTEE
jgi:hypothetical protein